MTSKDGDFVNGVTQKSHQCCVWLQFLLVSLLFYTGGDPTMPAVKLFLFGKRKVNDGAERFTQVLFEPDSPYASVCCLF